MIHNVATICYVPIHVFKRSIFRNQRNRLHKIKHQYSVFTTKPFVYPTRGPFQSSICSIRNDIVKFNHISFVSACSQVIVTIAFVGFMQFLFIRALFSHAFF